MLSPPFGSRVYGNPETHLTSIVWTQLIEIETNLIYKRRCVDGFLEISIKSSIKKTKLSFKTGKLRGTDIFNECLNQCALSRLSEIPPKRSISYLY